MNKEVSILIADLAGYTALTDIHGGEKAADTVFKFIEITKKSLIPPCELKETVGDEVVIVSTDSDSLLETAFVIRERLQEEVNFLCFHAGLHRGEIHTANGHMFGTTINLTSRIVSHAKRGQILCSLPFKQDIKKVKNLKFDSLGTIKFRNLRHSQEVFNILKSDGVMVTKEVDPVCKMHLFIDDNTPKLFYNDQYFYFCSEDCLNHFKKSPDHYLS